MLTGEILGTVKVIDQSYHHLPDQSGVHVALMRDGSLVQETTTDVQGNFSFEGVDYGKYTIPLTYEENYVNVVSYLMDRTKHVVYHVGGYSPTTVSYSIYEVPTWEIEADSVTTDDHYEFRIYLKINGDTLPPFPSVNPMYFRIMGYASNSPDVSADQYDARLSGTLGAPTTGSLQYTPTGAVYGELFLISGPNPSTDEIIYIRLYPIAGGQYSYAPINPDALGPPSNVVSFDH